MDETAKRHRTGGKVGGGSNGEKGGGSSNGNFEPSMGRFTDHIIINVLEKMDLTSICTAACVSPTFSFVFAYRLPFVSSSDLSALASTASPNIHVEIQKEEEEEKKDLFT
ncbi:hypothetical protein T459_21002 [Capsicum annuum]|uniref:F-box domain-containing protein n=1 Tax=Capsicum annuum TaxID=4072 RepID=A0A2G2Z647_CAPAN|nr:hypothetical protein T459_21002 [Capsicum annuum]